MPPQNQQPSPVGPPGEPQQPAPAPSRSLMFWWIVLAALLLWNLFVLWGKSTAEQATEIPYTTFLEQVRAGNVAEISLQGENIKGKFERAIVWPPPGEKASGTATEQTAVAKAGHQA